MKTKHAKPILSMEESEKMLGLNKGTGINSNGREVSERNEKKKIKLPEGNKNHENQCPYDSCEWANKINGVCSMPHCMKKIIKIKK